MNSTHFTDNRAISITEAPGDRMRTTSLQVPNSEHTGACLVLDTCDINRIINLDALVHL